MDEQTPAPAPQPSQQSAPRKWYKKKRYLIPLGFVGIMAAASLGGGNTPPATQTVPQIQVKTDTTVAPSSLSAPTSPVPGAPQVSPQTPTPKPAPFGCHIPAPNGYYTNVDGNCVPRPYQAPAAPAGATAQCRDGSYSSSQHRSGTCSHHGGVEKWLE